MKTIHFWVSVSILLLGFGWGTDCASQKVLGSYSAGKTEAASEESETHSAAQPANAPEVEPSLYHFVSNSDYVLTAWASDKKRPTATKGNLFSGSIYSFQTEKVYYARSDSEKLSGKKNTIQDFQIYTPSGSDAEIYSKGHRYLIFLQAQPKQEEFIKEYELPKGKTYYKAFKSKTKYLSTDPPIGLKGIIDLADGDYQDLLQQIQTFCEALGEPNKTTRLKNLRTLTNSSDEIIKSNADYALKVLQDNGNQP